MLLTVQIGYEQTLIILCWQLLGVPTEMAQWLVYLYKMHNNLSIGCTPYSFSQWEV